MREHLSCTERIVSVTFFRLFISVTTFVCLTVQRVFQVVYRCSYPSQYLWLFHMQLYVCCSPTYIYMYTTLLMTYGLHSALYTVAFLLVICVLHCCASAQKLLFVNIKFHVIATWLPCLRRLRGSAMI